MWRLCRLFASLLVRHAAAGTVIRVAVALERGVSLKVFFFRKIGLEIRTQLAEGANVMVFMRAHEDEAPPSRIHIAAKP